MSFLKRKIAISLPFFVSIIAGLILVTSISISSIDEFNRLSTFDVSPGPDGPVIENKAYEPYWSHVLPRIGLFLPWLFVILVATLFFLRSKKSFAIFPLLGITSIWIAMDIVILPVPPILPPVSIVDWFLTLHLQSFSFLFFPFQAIPFLAFLYLPVLTFFHIAIAGWMFRYWFNNRKQTLDSAQSSNIPNT